MPAHYECSECKDRGVKLWRQYQVCADAIDLLCRPCAIRASGKSEDDLVGDQIGWRVPAVPDPLPGPDLALAKDVSWWGYTSVPPRGCQWWYKLAGLPERDYPDERVEREERQVELLRRDRDEALKRNINSAVGFVRASDDETLALWQLWHQRLGVAWADINPGYMFCAGAVGGDAERPVWAAVRFARIGSRFVFAFWQVTSLARDDEMVEAHLAREYPDKHRWSDVRAFEKHLAGLSLR